MGPIFFSGPRGNSRARSVLRSRARRKSARAARIAPAAIAPRWAALLGFRLAQRSCCACGGARGSPRLRARPRVGPPAALRPSARFVVAQQQQSGRNAAQRQNQAAASGFFASCRFFAAWRGEIRLGWVPGFVEPGRRRGGRRPASASDRCCAPERDVRSDKPPAAATFDAVFGTCGQPSPRCAQRQR